MLRTLAFLAFFCSGFTSLLLETLWMRMLVLIFGGTTLAIVTILTAFMGGLALGSALAGRLSSRIKRPLWVYGWLELGVALYAASSPLWIGKIPFLYQWVPLEWPFLATAFVRFVLCVLLLLIPTALMGATLPVLSQVVARQREHLGFDVGMLYSVNTWGAVTGTLLGGFVLLPLWGHQSSLWFASSLLLLVALGMLWYSRQRAATSAHSTAVVASDAISADTANTDTANTDAISADATSADATSADATSADAISADRAQRSPSGIDTVATMAAFAQESSARQRVLALWCLGLTGATAMICQVVWSRALAMVIGSSTYAFTLILGLFLLGLAAGAMWGAWLVRRSMQPAASWSLLLLLTGLSIAVGNLVIDRLPLLFVWLVYDSVGSIGVLGMFVLKALLTALPVFLPTLLMGTFFPLALAIYASHDESASATVGRLYAASTLGSIVGSVSTGFVLIPWLGLGGSLALCVVLYSLAAIAMALSRPKATQDLEKEPEEALFPVSQQRRNAIVVLALLAAIAIWWAPRWHPGRMSLGMFRLSLMNLYTYETAKTPGHVLFYREGISATVTVQGGERHRGLKVNGKADASSISDSGTQVASAALPLLLHPAPRDVMIIGWGSGMTAGAALHFPLRQLTAVEIEPAVVTASRLFRRWNFRPQRDKRLRLLYNDGRNVLARSPQHYDVISSEPSNPWMSGTANLFSAEFFRLSRSRLKAGGLHCQFIQLYELSYRNILVLLRSARSAFPYVRLFEVQPNNYDTMLIASNQPIPLDLQALQQRMAPARYKELWRRIGIDSVYDWMPRLAMGEQEIDELVKQHPVPLNTDDHNVIEFSAPYDLVRHATSNAASTFQRRVKAFGMRFRRYFRWQGRSLTAPQSATFWLRTSRAFLRYGKIAQATQLLTLAQKAGAPAKDTQKLRRMLLLMQSQERAPALPVLKDVPLQERGSLLMLHKARKLFFDDQEKQSIFVLKKLLRYTQFVKQYPAVWFYLGANSRHIQAYRDAYRYYQRYIMHSGKEAKTKKSPQTTSRPTPQTTSRPTSKVTSYTTPHPTSRVTSKPTSRPRGVQE